tara:strand:- start:227 stop:1099 length:873 start_codon:yes stop_codon:yes gene_type:complete
LGNNLKIVQTVDFFTPILDDPYDWGRVAAANALSDIYAMGGVPISSLQLVSWPREDIGFDILSSVINGGSDVMKSANCSIVGGHSIDDKEPKYGFAVTGIINEKIYKKTDIKKGDRLFLTKPLGSGIIATAIKKGKAEKEAISQVTEIMTTLNDRGLAVAKNLNANAVTDVTGFGLLGHLSEMLINDNLSANLIFDDIPIIEYAKKYFEEGIYPSGSQRNFNSLKDFITFENEDEALILSDAQTSGGLLIAAPKETNVDFSEIEKSHGVIIKEIGNITDRYNKKINIISN